MPIPGEKIENRNQDKRLPTDKHFKPTSNGVLRHVLYSSPMGHELVFDNSPDATQVRLSSGSGTNITIGNDGEMISTVVGNEHKYNKQGQTSTIDGNSDSKTGGHSRTSVSGGEHKEVLGSVNRVKGSGSPHGQTSLNTEKITAKSIEITAEQSITLVAPEISINGTKMVIIRAENTFIYGYTDLIMNSGNMTSMKSGGPTQVKASRIDLNP